MNEIFDQYSKQCKQMAKSLNFEPDLKQIFKLFGESKDKKLANEVIDFYMNLSVEKSRNDLENKIKKNLNKWN